MSRGPSDILGLLIHSGGFVFYCLDFDALALKTWRRALALWVLSLGLMGACAFAKELHIVTIDSAPFGHFGVDGKPAGMMYEIGNLIAAEAGFTSTNQIIPYARTVHAVAQGDADFVLRYGSTELTSAAIQVARVLSLPTIIVGKPSFKFESLQDLHGKTVATPRGGRFDDDFAADTKILKYQVSDYAQMLRMLMGGRFDAALGSSVGLFYNAQSLGISKEQLGKPLVLSTQSFELHFSKKTADEETITALKNAVARLENRNEIKKIVNKYLSTFNWDLPSK